MLRRFAERVSGLKTEALKWATVAGLAATMAFQAYGNVIVPASALDSLIPPNLTSPSMGLSSQVIDFGPNLATITNSVTVTNISPNQISIGVPMYFQTPSVTSNNVPLFDFHVSPSYVGPVSSGQTTTLNIVYTPQVLGTNVTGRYLISASDGTSAALTVLGVGLISGNLPGYAYGYNASQAQVAVLPSKMIVQGNGYQPALGNSPDLSLSQTQILFGNVTVGQKAVTTILISNTSGSPVTINVISLFQSGATNLEYSVTGIAANSTLAASGQPGSQAITKLTFAPTTPGSIYGVINLFESSGNTRTITLLGTGITTNKVILAWKPSTSENAGYELYRASNSGGPFFRVNTSFISATNYADQTVQPNQTYFWVATSVATNSDSTLVGGPNGESFFSNMATFTTTNGTATSP